ncbi:MAG TPA: hypothetical protein VGM09_18330 [Bradyrhizobium sp.]
MIVAAPGALFAGDDSRAGTFDGAAIGGDAFAVAATDGAGKMLAIEALMSMKSRISSDEISA